MTNKIFFVLFLCFLYYGCREKNNNPGESTVIQNNQYEDSTLRVAMRKFGLSYQQRNNQSDSSSLVFYCLKSFDSSFLIHLRQEQNGISGAYFVETNSYYNANDYAAQENYLLFFEGYSFTLDSIKWRLIKSNAEELLRDTSFRNSPGCRDCKEYGLSYNFKSKVDNGLKYEPFYTFLKELLLENFIEKRRSFSYKEK